MEQSNEVEDDAVYKQATYTPSQWTPTMKLLVRPHPAMRVEPLFMR